MANLVYPPAVRPGGTIGVPSPSSGVDSEFAPRLADATNALTARRYRVELGTLVRNGGLVSGSISERVDELQTMFARDDVNAVLPPWGGELAIDMLDTLDWAALAADPKWFAGWSDISTLLLPLTVMHGVATLHGANLMDEPYELPTEFVRWTDVISGTVGTSFEQQAAPHRRTRPWGDWADEPLDAAKAYETTTHWKLLSGASQAEFSGRLIGGCLDTVALLAATPYGDVPAFQRRYAPEGLVVYLEVSDADAVSTARMLRSLRLAGWFTNANGVLIGRTTAPNSADMTQLEAVAHALGDLPIPVIVDFDAGHEPPQMPLVNGAIADVRIDGRHGSIRQTLTP
ncbi:S66 family peptidase [Leifsonia sp. A12D58]|uniref:S66 family peptidase n=1 Tax=Leifsonia sp. A12D58 TaxID=3397674 RepID=UPI0039E167FC